jgi:hypothetical protein
VGLADVVTDAVVVGLGVVVVGLGVVVVGLADVVTDAVVVGLADVVTDAVVVGLADVVTDAVTVSSPSNGFAFLNNPRNQTPKMITKPAIRIIRVENLFFSTRFPFRSFKLLFLFLFLFRAMCTT